MFQYTSQISRVIHILKVANDIKQQCSSYENRFLLKIHKD